MSLFLWKIIFLISVACGAIALSTWVMRNLHWSIRKPIVFILYPISCIPRILVSLLNGDAYTDHFWQTLKNNAQIAWNGRVER